MYVLINRARQADNYNQVVTMLLFDYVVTMRYEDLAASRGDVCRDILKTLLDVDKVENDISEKGMRLNVIPLIQNSTRRLEDRVHLTYGQVHDCDGEVLLNNSAAELGFSGLVTKHQLRL